VAAGDDAQKQGGFTDGEEAGGSSGDGHRHTPGPWEIETLHDGRTFIRSEHQRESTFGTICDLYCRNDMPGGFYQFPNAEANARLIAAAPQMAAAIQTFVKRYRDDFTGEMNSIGMVTGTDIDAFRTALRSAGLD
jgi:hypothetical protein